MAIRSAESCRICSWWTECGNRSDGSNPGHDFRSVTVRSVSNGRESALVVLDQFPAQHAELTFLTCRRGVGPYPEAPFGNSSGLPVITLSSRSVADFPFVI